MVDSITQGDSTESVTIEADTEVRLVAQANRVAEWSARLDRWPDPPVGPAETVQPPMSDIENARQIFRARRFGISAWRGTASTAPLTGLHRCPKNSQNFSGKRRKSVSYCTTENVPILRA